MVVFNPVLVNCASAAVTMRAYFPSNSLKTQKILYYLCVCWGGGGGGVDGAIVRGFLSALQHLIVNETGVTLCQVCAKEMHLECM